MSSRPLPAFTSVNAYLFRYLIESTGYFGISPLLSSSNLPSNDTIEGLVNGLAEAHRAYGVPECVLLEFLSDGAYSAATAHTFFLSSSPMNGTYLINAC
jgi:hypothetical protein